MRQRDHFQFSLVIIVLILTSSILLFGGVYLVTLNTKFQSILSSPFLKASEQFTLLQEENDQLHKELTDVRALLKRVEHEVFTPTLDPSQRIKLSTPEPEIILPTENKVSITVDSKCFLDPTDLNQCAVLATAQLSETIAVVVKPVGSIKEDLNELVFEFFDGATKITEFKTTTKRLFESEPIAEIAFIARNDITLSTKIGVSSIQSVYTYDGQGWIDYNEFTKNQ
jgi:hypothetical protein